MAESEELKSFLIKVKEESEKIGLKLNIQQMILASGPSCQIEREKVEAMTDFILLGSWITADDDWSHENRNSHESYDKPRQYIKKQRHHFADKGLYSESYGFFQ